MAIPAASASTLVFSRDQTLGGWHEREFTTSWTDLAPDVKSRISTDVNGDLRGFNQSSTTVWLQSPEFILESGAITIASIYLMEVTAQAPSTDADISAEMGSNGWAGVALRDASGNFVLTWSAVTAWQPAGFTSEQLAPFVGQTLTLNFINSNNSSGDFLYVNRPITIEGSLAAVPEPSALLSTCGLLAGVLLLRRRGTTRR